ncbi:MAG: hypothetical protein WD061_03505 [Candidatus Saccharimonadales bacterium]
MNPEEENNPGQQPQNNQQPTTPPAGSDGSQVGGAAFEPAQAQPVPESQPQPTGESKSSPAAGDGGEKPATLALVVGAVGLVAWIWNAWVGLAVAIVALALSFMAKKEDQKLAQVALLVAVVALIASVVAFFMG